MIPNFQDKRVKKRILEALSYVNQNLDPVKPTELMSIDIKRHIGNYTPGTLADFLFKTLFIRKTNYSTGLLADDGTEIYKARPNGYVLNLDGFKTLHDALNNPELSFSVDLVPSYAKSDKAKADAEDLKRQIETGDFTYLDSSSRLWNQLQNMRRHAKRQFWESNNYAFNYDIQACAPTLLLGLALKFGEYQCLPARLAPIKHFIENRDVYRQRVASLANISESEAKRLINSLFNGGRLVATPFCAAFETVNENPEAIVNLKRDPLVKALITSIKFVWMEIKFGLQRGTIDGDYKYDFPIRKVISPADKWALYFYLERQVMDVVIDCCQKYEARIFREHDGFISDKELNLEEIKNCVKEKTGFSIQIESAWN